MSGTINVAILLRSTNCFNTVVHVRQIILGTKQAAENIVARNFGVSLVASIAALAAASGLLLGAPKHYIATLHATPGAAAVPIDWILGTDQIKHDMVANYRLTEHYGGIAEPKAIKKLKHATTVVRTVGSGVDIEVTDKSAEMAAKLASGYGQAIYKTTLEQRLTKSSTLLYEVRIRKAHAMKYLREAEAALSKPEMTAAIKRMPLGWIEFISNSGPVLAADALNSVGPYQTNGPSAIVLETQRLAVLAAIAEQQREKKMAPSLQDAFADCIRAMQEVAYWRALGAGMREQEEILIDQVKAETTSPAVQVPTEATWTYAVTPWVAGILLAFSGAVMALLISNAFGQRARGIAQT